MSTPSSNMYFEAIHTSTTPPSDPNLFTAAEMVAGSFDSAAVSTATSKAVSTVNAAAPDSTSISQANSRAVSAASVGSIADSKAVSVSGGTSIADSRALSVSVNTSIADSKGVSVANSVPILTVVANSQNVSIADSKAVSVATTLLPALPYPVLNVKAAPYSAVGNGTADDTAAVQAAITAATGAVFFPPGTYKITSALTLNPGSMLLGAGYLNTSISVTGAIRGLVYEPTGLTEAAIEIRNLRVTGSSAATTLSLVNFKNCTGLKIIDCDIRTTSQDAVVIDTCYVTEIRSRIESFRRYGVYLLNSNAWSVRTCDFQANAENCTAALYLSGSGYGSVMDSNFEGASRLGDAIQISNASIVTIEDNYMELYGGACISARTSASRGIAIKRNSLACSNSSYLDFSGVLAHTGIAIEQNRAANLSGGSLVFDPGATVDFIYRQNSKDAGNHVVGYPGFNQVIKDDTATSYSEAGRRLQNGTATGTSIDASLVNYVEVTNGSAANIAAITGNGYQFLILRFMDGNSTVLNNAVIRLAGAVNYAPGINDTLTLVHIGSNVWLEIARSNN